MEWLAKFLYPGHPKLVRFRKVQALCFAAVLCVLACVAVGVAIYMLNRGNPK